VQAPRRATHLLILFPLERHIDGPRMVTKSLLSTLLAPRKLRNCAGRRNHPCRKSSPTTNRAAGRKNISLTAAAARLAGNEPTGGSFRRRQCRFFGRLGTDSPTAKVRMPSTVMTPGAMLVRGHIRIRCCTFWRRRLLVIRLSHRQILRHCNGRQCADNQGAAYKSDIHPRLRVLLQIRMPMAMTSVVKTTRTPYPGQGQRQVQ
jgi:hypothetical protein